MHAWQRAYVFLSFFLSFFRRGTHPACRPARPQRMNIRDNARMGESAPDTRKQLSGFPPNYIHRWVGGYWALRTQSSARCSPAFVTWIACWLLKCWPRALTTRSRAPAAAAVSRAPSSLDGAHMLMAAVAVRREGACFAAVHDSFWTHAADVDLMNRAVRCVPCSARLCTAAMRPPSVPRLH
jgi:hypothetical protein